MIPFKGVILLHLMFNRKQGTFNFNVNFNHICNSMEANSMHFHAVSEASQERKHSATLDSLIYCFLTGFSTLDQIEKDTTHFRDRHLIFSIPTKSYE